jgi:hypothetical protein
MGCRIVGDGRKRIETRFTSLRPVIPETGNKHVTRGLRIVLQDKVFFLLIGSEFAMLIQVLGDTDEDSPK